MENTEPESSSYESDLIRKTESSLSEAESLLAALKHPDHGKTDYN